MSAPSRIASITVDWGEADKTPGERREWLSSWVVNDDGEEGDFLYDGVGGTTTTHAVPEDAIGVRFRWAPQVTDELHETRRQWTVLRKLYLFSEHPEPIVKAMNFCS